MLTSKGFQVRWRDRLSVRIGLFVAVAIIVGDDLTGPIYDYVIPIEEEVAVDADGSWIRLKYLMLSTAYGCTLGALLGLFFGRYSIPRLRAIVLQASQATNDEIPGPFEEKGKDEIAFVAKALNQMRDRTVALLERLDERDSKRNEWVAQVSHDLRTPLTALITSLEHTAVLLDRGESDLAVLRRNNGVALMDAQRVGMMAEDLLDIARLEIRDSLRIEAVLPCEIVEHIQRGLMPIALKSGVDLRFEFESDPPSLEADGHLLKRALENLMLNSIQHSRTFVSTSVSQVGNSLRFRVEDDGDGFPECPDEVSFAKLRNLRSRADSTGLGLLVVARVAQMHGGQVTGRNRDKGGAQIDMLLPIAGPS
ncbi:MAG: HAMP domain-containing sensor histidine kinase [Planctomycetota bacterium]|nr:HAMP domain-containing sensor histidine kinase [Planctomycetota bacterium]MDG2143167.1 HAMP domain-containing sensor histidine kinase [Planctomycetota bacterium]